MKKALSILLTIVICISFGNIAYADESISISTPKLVSVSRKGTGKAKIQWKGLDKVSGYEIEYSQNADYSSSKIIKVAASSTSASIENLSSKAPTYIHIRAYKNNNQGITYSSYNAGAKIIPFNTKWKYAKNSKIHTDSAVLYYSSAKNRKNINVAINAGHGCKGGSSKKTLCHPDGTKKVTGGSTSAGAKYATSINEGTSLKGMSEATGNLKIAMKVKSILLAKGYNVLMLRQDSNTQLDNIARTVIANNNADCHIAIHFDSTSSNKGALVHFILVFQTTNRIAIWSQLSPITKSITSLENA